MDNSDLYYEPYSLALFIVSQELGARRSIGFLNELYTEECAFFHPKYLKDKKMLFSETLFLMEYFVDKVNLDAEFPVVEKDFEAIGKDFINIYERTYDPNIDLFFMFMRLRILYFDEKKYERMKLRTLLRHYEYKKRSSKIVEHINKCLLFYQIQPYLRDYEQCEIETVDLDDMITFRIW